MITKLHFQNLSDYLFNMTFESYKRNRVV